MQKKTQTVHRRRIQAAVLCASSLFFFGTLQAISLQEAVQQMLATHPDVLSARSKEEAAEQDVKQAKGGWLPSVELDAGAGRQGSDNVATRALPSNPGVVSLTRTESNLALRQLLFDGGNVSGQIKERTASVRTAQFQLAQSQEGRVFDGTSAYLRVLQNQELLKVAKSDVATHRDTLNKVTKRLDAGAGRKSEVTLAQSRLALSEARYELAVRGLMDSRDTYAKVIGDAPENLHLPRVPGNLPGNLVEAQSLAMELNPAVAAAAAQYDVSTAAIGVAKAAYYPTFTLEAGLRFNDNIDGLKGHDNDALAIVRMNYNLFHGFSDEAAIHATIDRQAAALHDTDNIRRNVNEDVALAWNNLESARKRLPFLKSHQDDSWAVYDSYVKQYQLGQRTLFDLVNALTEYYDAKTAYIQGKYDIRIAEYRLLAGMGILVNTLVGAESSEELLVNDEAQKGYGVSVPPLPSPTNLDARGAENNNEARASSSMPNDDSEVALIDDGEDEYHPAPQLSAAPPSGRYYTVQLLAAPDQATAEDFITRHHIEDRASYYAVKVRGRTWYRVIYGNYASRQEAVNAMNQLPPRLNRMRPLVRIYTVA